MSEQSTSSLQIPEQQAVFRELVADALAHARKLGASDAVAEVSESKGLVVSVRAGDIETLEQTRDRSLDVTVYAGQILAMEARRSLLHPRVSNLGVPFCNLSRVSIRLARLAEGSPRRWPKPGLLPLRKWSHPASKAKH